MPNSSPRPPRSPTPKPSQIALAFHLLELRDDESLHRVLCELSGSIRSLVERLEDARNSWHDESYEMFVDDECDFVEALIGAGLVVAQAYINGIWSAWRSFVTCLGGVVPAGLPRENEKTKFLCFENPVLHQTAIHRVQAVDAVANMFKHHSDWPVDWKSPTPEASVKTRAICVALGIASNSTGRVRAGITTLGYSDFSLSKLSNDLEEWHKRVVSRARKVVEETGTPWAT